MRKPVEETRELVESSWRSFEADDAARKARESERRGSVLDRAVAAIRRLLDVLTGSVPRAVLFLVGITLLALVVLALISRSGGDDTATTPGSTAAPAVAGTGGATPGASAGDCLLPGVLDVTAVQTEEYPGNDTTQYRGEVTITNTSDEAVRLALFHSFSTGGSADTWATGAVLEPGASTTELVTAQSFEDGTATWDVVTDVAAYRDEGACGADLGAALNDADVAAFGDAAVAVANPLPVGP